MRRYKVGMDSQ